MASISLRESVRTHPSMADELPLVHTSRAEFLNSFKNTHALEPSHCAVFQENLIYLFYGRPAYRSANGNRYGESIALCPICFVFKPNALSQFVHRLFPCDSGAVNRPLFEPQLYPSDLPAIELEPDIESARRLVSLVFHTNKNYFFGKAVTGVGLQAGTVSHRYYELQMRQGPVDFDDRRSAIEVQFTQRIDLRNHLSFVVLPREFLEDSGTSDTISNIWNCDTIAYPTFHGDSPSAYYSVVRHEIARRFELEKTI